MAEPMMPAPQITTLDATTGYKHQHCKIQQHESSIDNCTSEVLLLLIRLEQR